MEYFVFLMGLLDILSYDKFHLNNISIGYHEKYDKIITITWIDLVL